MSPPERISPVSPGTITFRSWRTRDFLGASIADVFRDVKFSPFHAVPAVMSNLFVDPLRVRSLDDHCFNLLYERWNNIRDYSPVRQAYIANSYLGFMGEPMDYYRVPNWHGVEMVRNFRDGFGRPVYQALLDTGEMRGVDPEHMSWGLSGDIYLKKDWNLGIGNKLPRIGWNDILTRMLFKHLIEQYEEAPDTNMIFRSTPLYYLDSLLSQEPSNGYFWFSFCRQYSATFNNKRSSPEGAVKQIRAFLKQGMDLSAIVDLVDGNLSWRISGPDQILPPEQILPDGIVEGLRNAWEITHPEVSQLVEFELDTPSMSTLIWTFMERIRNGWIEGFSKIPPGTKDFVAKFDGYYSTFKLSGERWNSASVLGYNLFDL